MGIGTFDKAHFRPHWYANKTIGMKKESPPYPESQAEPLGLKQPQIAVLIR